MWSCGSRYVYTYVSLFETVENICATIASLESGKQEACGCGLIKGEEDHESSFKKAIEKRMTPKSEMQGLR